MNSGQNKKRCALPCLDLVWRFFLSCSKRKVATLNHQNKQEREEEKKEDAAATAEADGDARDSAARGRLCGDEEAVQHGGGEDVCGAERGRQPSSHRSRIRIHNHVWQVHRSRCSHERVSVDLKPSLGLCRWVREHEESVGECGGVFFEALAPFLVWVAEKQQASLFTTLFVCVFALHLRPFFFFFLFWQVDFCHHGAQAAWGRNHLSLSRDCISGLWFFSLLFSASHTCANVCVRMCAQHAYLYSVPLSSLSPFPLFPPFPPIHPFLPTPSPPTPSPHARPSPSASV